MKNEMKNVTKNEKKTEAAVKVNISTPTFIIEK